MPRLRVAALGLLFCCLLAAGCNSGGLRLLGGVLGSGGFGGNASATGVFQPAAGGGSPAAGACCLSSGDCLTVTASDCDAFAGLFYGPGLICGIAPCGSGL